MKFTKKHGHNETEKMMHNSKGLFIIPYAYGGNTGVSIQNVDKQLEIYMKNVCVAAVSAKRNGGENTDVMVVSNIDIPQPYVSILKSNGVLLDLCPFDVFNFGSQTKSGRKVRWQLAYYKLCALAHSIEKHDYGYYGFLDSDVFVQRSFDRIWTDAQYNIMLYDVNEPCDGYMVKEMQDFLNIPGPLTHFGGEFFAASRSLALDFISECKRIFETMVERDFVSDNGDEFITSIAASRLKDLVKNAGAYIRRYWTGSYRLVCSDFDKNNITILHVPAEKEQGIIKIYNRFVSKSELPSGAAVWRLLHLNHPSWRVRTAKVLRRIGLIK